MENSDTLFIIDRGATIAWLLERMAQEYKQDYPQLDIYVSPRPPPINEVKENLRSHLTGKKYGRVFIPDTLDIIPVFDEQGFTGRAIGYGTTPYFQRSKERYDTHISSVFNDLEQAFRRELEGRW